MVIHLLHVRLSLAFSAQCLTETINLSFVHFPIIPLSLLNVVLGSISTISSVYFLWVVWGTCPQCCLLIPGQCSRITGYLEHHEVPVVTPGLLHVKPGCQDLISHSGSVLLVFSSQVSGSQWPGFPEASKVSAVFDKSFQKTKDKSHYTWTTAQ